MSIHKTTQRAPCCHDNASIPFSYACDVWHHGWSHDKDMSNLSQANHSPEEKHEFTTKEWREQFTERSQMKIPCSCHACAFLSSSCCWSVESCETLHPPLDQAEWLPQILPIHTSRAHTHPCLSICPSARVLRPNRLFKLARTCWGWTHLVKKHPKFSL